jgi:hypothetical protein
VPTSVQERFLPPRAIHFASDQIYWECTHVVAPECVSSSLIVGNPRQKSQIAKMSADAEAGNNQALGMILSQVWDWVVADYSRSRMTRESDRSVGIAGLARAIAGALGLCPSDYLHGLWRPTFIHDLLWHARSHRSGALKKTTGNSCTWSWLSVTGEMKTRHLDANVLRTIAIAQLVFGETIPYMDPFGRVVSGYARLRAPMCKFTFTEDENGASVLNVGTKFFGPESTTIVWDDRPLSQLLEDSLDESFYLMLYRALEETPKHYLGVDHVPRPPRFGNGVYEGLILRPKAATSGIVSPLRRVEYFCCRESFSTRGTRTTEQVTRELDVCRSLDELFSQRNIPTDLYESVDDEDFYTITLV